jgi:hypothetical protein
VNIQSSNATPLAKKTFSYNPQDKQVVPDQKLDLDVTSVDGHPTTDTVVFANKKAIFDIFGRLTDIQDDPTHKLPENAQGDYTYAQGDEHHTDSTAFAATALTVNTFNAKLEELAGHKIDWAFGEQKLGVSPETGKWPNAFYARELKGVHYFDYKTTSTGDSGEVASHETGHAILDAQRPGYLEGVGLETGAFHEAFGDILSSVMTLQNDEAIAKIVAETGGTGDLSSGQNSLSQVGEDFGVALGLKGGIRTTLNNFKYQDPSTLPDRGDDTHLGNEVHDFARLYAGAFYDVLDGISDANRAAGMAPAEALKEAGKEALNLVVGQTEFAPKGSEALYRDLAAGLIEGDKKFNGGKRSELIANVMANREILSKEAASGLFKSEGPTFTGEVVNREVTFGKDFGALAGVKYQTEVDVPSDNIFASEVPTSSQVESGVKSLLAHDEILFGAKGQPSIGELFKPDGSYYKAYVSTNEAGEKVLQRTHIAG